MSRTPMIRIRLPSGSPDEYIIGLEQARELINFSEGVFLVEGQGVQSFDELVAIAERDEYRDKDYVDVQWLQVVGGG